MRASVGRTEIFVGQVWRQRTGRLDPRLPTTLQVVAFEGSPVDVVRAVLYRELRPSGDYGRSDGVGVAVLTFHCAVVKLSPVQQRVLRLLAEAGGSKLAMRSDRGLPAITLTKLSALGLVVMTPGGSETRCPKSGIAVFTPGPATARITDAGRATVECEGGS